MRIHVKVRARARETSVTPQADGSLLVSVTAIAHKGEANVAVIQAVAKHFGVPKSTVSIVSGATSSRKVLEVREPTQG